MNPNGNGHQPPAPDEQISTEAQSPLELSAAQIDRLIRAAVQTVKVGPGERLLVTFPPGYTQKDVGTVLQALKNWAPDVEFMVLSGAIGLASIPKENQTSKGLILP